MFTHTPLLLDEVLTALTPVPGSVLVDCTFGRGGHSGALLARVGETGRVLAIDKDPEAVAAARALAARDQRLTVAHASFSELESLVEREGINGRVAGVLYDLGVSSPQLDDASRGFSFKEDGPLDMRMDPNRGMSAAQWINRVKATELAEVLRNFGEERYARRISRAIVDERSRCAIETTSQLADIVRRASPSRERTKHPATRTFQALRIFVNRELEELEQGLLQAVEVLAPRGRLAVISFHSLEDRITKRFIRARARPSGAHLPIGAAPPKPTLSSLGKPVYPSAEELASNPRARSAVLRVAERLP